MLAIETSPVQLLLFQIEGRSLALPVGAIREVVRAVAITPLPMAPRIVEGVINYRGTLTPVLDLRARFGLPPVPLAPDQHFLVAQVGDRLVALRVDRAHGVLEIGQGAIDRPEDVVRGTVHVAGLAGGPDGVVVIQDLEQFLSPHELADVEAALARVRVR